jgi:hypothetical protein
MRPEGLKNATHSGKLPSYKMWKRCIAFLVDIVMQWLNWPCSWCAHVFCGLITSSCEMQFYQELIRANLSIGRFCNYPILWNLILITWKLYFGFAVSSTLCDEIELILYNTLTRSLCFNIKKFFIHIRRLYTWIFSFSWLENIEWLFNKTKLISFLSRRAPLYFLCCRNWIFFNVYVNLRLKYFSHEI